MRDPFERRGRDLNPRRSFHHVRDFQSRSLGHSDTSPGASRVAGRPLGLAVVDVSPASPAWAGPGRRATRPGLRRASPRDRAEHRWRSSSGAASGARLSAGWARASSPSPARPRSRLAPVGARPSAPASWRVSTPHAGVAAEDLMITAPASTTSATRRRRARAARSRRAATPETTRTRPPPSPPR